ncbi:MAG: acyloxyacyl hydrolase [Bacteroidota bacterium]
MKKILTLLFLFDSLFCFSQNDSVPVSRTQDRQHFSVQLTYQHGYVFGTNAFLKGKNIESQKIKAFQTVSVKFSKQTVGKKLWEQLYQYPNWGFGAYLADFYHPRDVGYPIAVYGFLNSPFKRWRTSAFNFEIGFGATFNWKCFNPLTNQYNTAIGAGQSFLIDAGLNFEQRLLKKLAVSIGFSVTHFSNGALKKPNFGINTIAPRVGIKYNFFEAPAFIKQAVPHYHANNEWLLSVFGGAKNVVYDSVSTGILEKYEGVFFPVFGLSALYNRQISYKSKFGLGMTFSYDGSVNAQVAVDNNEIKKVKGPLGDNLQLSIYPSYELVAGRVSIILQPAFYLYRKKMMNQSPVFHQRIGLKYHLTNHIFVGITLRDYHFHVSDFVEWSVGYRIR